MKKLFFILSIFLGLSFVSCSGNDDTEIPDAPYIITTGLSADQTIELKANMTLKINVVSAGYLASLQCTTESSTLVPWLMSQGMGSTIDFVNPNSIEDPFLTTYGITHGDDLLGGQSVTIDFSKAMPNLLKLGDDNIDHTFKLVITDFYGQQMRFNFVVKQTKIQ